MRVEYEYVCGNGSETLRADVSWQDVAEVAVRCAALGMPGVWIGTTLENHLRSPTVQVTRS